MEIIIYSKYFFIQILFAILGIFSYIAFIIFFYFYFRCLILIKENIFTFIILNSFTSLIELFIYNPLIKSFFIYLSNIIQFYLILNFIDKCFKSIKLSKGIIINGINYKSYIILIFMLIYFPYAKTIYIFEKNAFAQYFIKMILLILLYEIIRERIYNLLEYLNEMKIDLNDSNIKLNSKESNNNLEYNIINYYYKSLQNINSIFFLAFVLFMLFFGIKILNCFFTYIAIFKYIAFFINIFGIYCIIIGCFLFFYSFNKNIFERNKKENKKDEKIEIIQKVKVIYIE